MGALATLHGDGLLLRPAREEDLAEIFRLRRAPEVAAWWGAVDEERDRDYHLAGLVIEIDGAVAGWLEFHEETEPDYRSVSFDLFLAAPLHGRGHGPEALRTAIEHFAAQGHHRFTIDPATENARAIRAYEKLGFRPVGILRRAERAPDGRWRDGLLMDLLAEELTPRPGRPSPRTSR